MKSTLSLASLCCWNLSIYSQALCSVCFFPSHTRTQPSTDRWKFHLPLSSLSWTSKSPVTLLRCVLTGDIIHPTAIGRRMIAVCGLNWCKQALHHVAQEKPWVSALDWATYSQRHSAQGQPSPLTSLFRPAIAHTSPEHSTAAISSEGSALSSLKKPQICCLKPDISSFSLLLVLFVLSNADLEYSPHLKNHFFFLASLQYYFFPPS